MLSRTLPLSLLLSLAPLAQTFVVDAQNGAGTHFTSLAAAVAAVPSGSTLLVRGGRYFETLSIQGKALAIVCNPAATVLQPFWSSASIGGLAAHQDVTIRNLVLFANTNNPATVPLHVTDAEGLVLLDGVRGAGNQGVQLTVRNCRRVSLRGCELRGMFNPSVACEGADVCFESCWLGREDTTSGQTGLQQRGGALQLVDCRVDGGGSFFGQGGAAVDTDGDLRVFGSSALRGGFSTNLGFAIAGTGVVRLEPSVQLSGANPPLDPRLRVTVAPMPRLTGTADPTSGAVTIDLHGPVGHAAAVFVGLPGPRLPLLRDAVWLAPSLVLRLSGVPQQGAPLSFRTSPLRSLAPLGFCLGWQAATLDSGGNLQLSNPVFHVAW